MKSNSLLSILKAIELEIGLHLDPKKTQFSSKKEEYKYRKRLTNDIIELNKEFTELVYQIETQEVRTQLLFAKFKPEYRLTMNYMLNELTQFDPLYTRFQIGIKKIKKLKYHFH